MNKMIKIRRANPPKAKPRGKFVLKAEERKVRPNLKDLGYNEGTRRLFHIEASIEDLRNEAKQHECRALEARQDARDLLEQGRDYEARKQIELMLAERQYILACGVTARRIRKVMNHLREAGRKGYGVAPPVVERIMELDKAIHSKVLVDIELCLSKLESVLEPEMTMVPSIVNLVERVKRVDVNHIEKEIREELKFLTNLSGNVNKTKRQHRKKLTERYKRGSKLEATSKLPIKDVSRPQKIQEYEAVSGSTATDSATTTSSEDPKWSRTSWSR